MAVDFHFSGAGKANKLVDWRVSLASRAIWFVGIGSIRVAALGNVVCADLVGAETVVGRNLANNSVFSCVVRLATRPNSPVLDVGTAP